MISNSQTFSIDTHCHLYETVFQHDLAQVIKNSVDAGVEKILIPNIDQSSISDLLALCKDYPQNCFPMLGLHPCYVKENFLSVLDAIEPLLTKEKCVGVGEIGLDFYHDTTFQKQQLEALAIQLDWAEKYQLPVSLHSRNATQQVIDLIKTNHRSVRGVFHCFTESKELAKQIVDLGFSVGIGGVLTFKNAGIAEVIKSIPLEKIVLETDAPYLSPQSFRGKRNEPAYTKIIAEKLAEILHLSVAEIIHSTTQNANQIFFP